MSAEVWLQKTLDGFLEGLVKGFPAMPRKALQTLLFEEVVAHVSLDHYYTAVELRDVMAAATKAVRQRIMTKVAN